MDEEEDMDIAAAMGFGSFGGTKKRKYDHTKSPKATADASGANSTQLGVRTKKAAGTQKEEVEVLEATDSENFPATGPVAFSTVDVQTTSNRPPQRQPARIDHSATETVSFGGPPITKAELNALKFGIKNDNGDTAYFLPSFVEDPWKSLRRTDT